MTRLLEACVYQLGIVAVFLGMRGMVVVEIDMKIGEVPLMLLSDTLDELLGRNAFFACPDHDRGAMGVIGTDIDALMTLYFLKTCPDISLDVFY
jgi:hypothetical protein